jgi:hypothetical protein
MMADELPLEMRLSRLTVNSLRNLCDAHNVPGASNMLKDELIAFVAKEFNSKTLEEFCRAQEDIYFVENMAKAIKWAANRKIVAVDPKSDYSMVNAVFTLRRSDGYEVYNIRFVNQTTDDVGTSCECMDSRERGYFCPHQMAVLVRCLTEGMFGLDQWSGPMTPEAEDLILANVFRKRRKRR